eukprot:m.1639326 g.1639326  ORF g.1639326 m.1639326 type:complete len:621 (-) comp34637_c0_seq1:216-2078(-)
MSRDCFLVRAVVKTVKHNGWCLAQAENSKGDVEASSWIDVHPKYECQKGACISVGVISNSRPGGAKWFAVSVKEYIPRTTQCRWEAWQDGDTALTLPDTANGSSHAGIQLQCWKCGTAAIKSDQIHRVKNNAVWTNTSRIIGTRIRDEVSYNKFKRTKVQSVMCSGCNAILGTCYKEPYYDSDTQRLKEGQDFPCFKLTMFKNQPGNATEFNLVLVGSSMASVQQSIAKLITTQEWEDFMAANPLQGRMNSAAFELIASLKAEHQEKQAEIQRKRTAVERDERQLRMDRRKLEQEDAERQRRVAHREAVATAELERTRAALEKVTLQQANITRKEQALRRDQVTSVQIREQEAQALRKKHDELHAAHLHLQTQKRQLQQSLGAPPPYWRGIDGKYETKFMQGKIEASMNASSGQSSTGCACRHTFKVTKVERIENMRLWRNYCSAQNDVRDRLAKANETGSGLPENLCATGGLRAALEPARILDEDINEFYMFHGTSEDTMKIIIEGGFDERVASDGGLYGAGTYFADQACKSAQYCKGSGQTKCMLYSRVTMGWAYAATGGFKGRRPPPIPGAAAIPHDSIFARGAVARHGEQIHNEYIVFRQLAYPEFVIWFTCGECR